MDNQEKATIVRIAENQNWSTVGWNSNEKFIFTHEDKKQKVTFGKGIKSTYYIGLLIEGRDVNSVENNSTNNFKEAMQKFAKCLNTDGAK